jgi:ferredoxin
MKFTSEELTLTDERLSEFPIDADDSVCPLDAIVWERGFNTPAIIADLCINCGICARRCPVGAIYSNGDSAIIHIGESNVEFLPVTDENMGKHTAQIETLLQCRHEGEFITPSEISIATLYKKLNEQQTKSQFPNLIIRNLFLVLGNQCIIRRKGDIYFRIDAVLADKPVIGVAEVEFNKDSLESPRAILDDIAVLVSRYEIEKVQIKPFIISLEFPNVRTEYWRVIKDIRDVLGVHINSLSLGALCILVWRFVFAPIGKVDFYADINSPSIKSAIEKACGDFRISDISNYAVLEPKK